jgi:2-octaprenyl-6-methoxyphenol hydroxylase
MTKREISADLVIAGGGLVGLAMACAVARAGLAVVVVDPAEPRALLDAAFDGRASALAYASQQLLRSIDVWPHLEADSQPILDIRVTDGASPLFLHYHHGDLGDEPFGVMAENRHIRRALIEAAQAQAGITLLFGDRLAAVAREAGGIKAETQHGRRLRARLVIGAEGRGSPLRTQAGIRTTGWSYGQTGIVTTVAHEDDHHGVAHERFLPAGPFAILPLPGRRCSLVWTERDMVARAIMALDDDAFAAEMRKRFGDFLGAVSPIGPRWSYPLGLIQAERYTARRLALIGDAAHGVHPVAGQGLNMGLRDVAALAEVLVDAHRLGLDIGAEAALQRFARWRRFDNMLMAATMDGLVRLFSNDIAPLRAARRAGLAAVNRMAPLKRLFMRHARGTVGKLPRLLTGTPL